MKKNIFLILLLSAIVAYFFSSGRTNHPADITPVLIGNGVISTEDDEFGATFSPDGNICYFTKKSPSTLQSNVYVICYSQRQNGKWTEPRIAPFSGKYKDLNPRFSPDGSKLFFISNRTDSIKKTPDTDIWMVKKNGEGWTEPENLGPIINTSGYELGCSLASDGTLYFSTTGNTGNVDLFRSKWIDGKYQKPEGLGELINTVYSESDPFVASDQSYILFTSEGRPDATPSGEGASANYQRSDIYISFYKDGKWSAPKNVGRPVNSPAEESGPSVSADGKTFYFTSEKNFIALPLKTKLEYSSFEKSLHAPQNGLGDIYQLPANEFFKNLK